MPDSLAEAFAIVAAVREHQPHQTPEMRHVLALADWGAALEQEVMSRALPADDGIVCATEEGRLA